MKRILQRIGGTVAFAVGMLGLIFTFFAVDQVWIAARYFSRELPAALGHLEGIVDSVHQQGRTTVGLLEVARERVKFIDVTVEELANQGDSRTARGAMLETLEEDLLQRLVSAEEFVVSMQNSLRSLSNALLVLDSIPFFSPRTVAPGGQRDSQLVSVATNLKEAASLLDQVTGTVGRIRLDQAITPRQLEQVRTTLDLVDRELRDVQWEVHEFSRRVESTGLQIKAIKRNGPPWIRRIAQGATLFFVCFGFSQLHLLLHGWHLLRAKRAP